MAVGDIFWSKRNREQYRTTVVEGLSSAENERIDYFKATGAKDLAGVKVGGSVDSARSRRYGSDYQIEVRVCLIAHIQLEYRSIRKCKRIRKKVPRSHDELTSVMDTVDEAFEKAAVELGEKLVERLL